MSFKDLVHPRQRLSLVPPYEQPSQSLKGPVPYQSFPVDYIRSLRLEQQIAEKQHKLKETNSWLEDSNRCLTEEYNQYATQPLPGSKKQVDGSSSINNVHTVRKLRLEQEQKLERQTRKHRKKQAYAMQLQSDLAALKAQVERHRQDIPSTTSASSSPAPKPTSAEKKDGMQKPEVKNPVAIPEAKNKKPKGATAPVEGGILNKLSQIKTAIANKTPSGTTVKLMLQGFGIGLMFAVLLLKVFKLSALVALLIGILLCQIGCSRIELPFEIGAKKMKA